MKQTEKRKEEKPTEKGVKQTRMSFHILRLI